MAYRNYSPGNGFLVSKDGNGNFSTIQAAITAATAGTTVFISDGTYTENLTLKAGVNLTAFSVDADTSNVTIIGNATLTAAGTVTIANIRLQTNSAAFLTVSGSAASIVNLENCYLNCTNNTGISFSSSSASATINVQYCNGDVGTTGIAIFSSSSAGGIGFNFCYFTNSGSSTTANTFSAGTFGSISSTFSNPITGSGTSQSQMNNSVISCGNLNTTAFSPGGTGAVGNGCGFCRFFSGTASAISVGAASTFTCYSSQIDSSNTNAITGSGTLNYSNLTFSNTSLKINTTTQVGGTIQGGVTQAPSTGFLGEQISSSASAVATTTATPKNITSISLTPGIWDITGMGACTATGGTAIAQALLIGISATSATFGSTIGIDFSQCNILINPTITLTVLPLRVTLTTTTTYYLVTETVYTSTTCPVSGKITATRVG